MHYGSATLLGNFRAVGQGSDTMRRIFGACRQGSMLGNFSVVCQESVTLRGNFSVVGRGSVTMLGNFWAFAGHRFVAIRAFVG